jgi:hypothetical protein
MPTHTKDQLLKEAPPTRPRPVASATSHETHPLLHLQRTIGNQAVQRILQMKAECSNADASHPAPTPFGHKMARKPASARAPLIQAKLKVGEPDDKFEEEADRVAELTENGNGSISPSAAAQGHNLGGSLQRLYSNQAVLQMCNGLGGGLPAPSVPLRPSLSGILQRKCACGGAAGMSGECEECSKKKRVGLQTKLKIKEPGDIYEQEADRIANQVMATPAHPAISSAPPRIQRFSGQSNRQMNTAPASVDQALASPGRPLEPALRRDMERRFGHDFSRVRLHSGAAAEQSARDVNATAYTVGHDIVFGTGRFAPATQTGQGLLAHELVHVVQQNGPQANPSSAILQRKKRGPAGGCGVCLGDPRVAGRIAHEEIQAWFKALDPDFNTEMPVQVVPGDETPPFTPRLDLALTQSEMGISTIFIGEIKPLDDKGQQKRAGREQLKDYARELQFTYDEVFRMELPAPPVPLPFINPVKPPTCPSQLLHVQKAEPGLYQYYCEPQCRCPRPTRRERERQRVPAEVSMPEEERTPEAKPVPPKAYRIHHEFREVFEVQPPPVGLMPPGHWVVLTTPEAIIRQLEGIRYMERTRRLMRVDIRGNIPMQFRLLWTSSLAVISGGVIAGAIAAVAATAVAAPASAAVAAGGGAATAGVGTVIPLSGGAVAVEKFAKAAAILIAAGTLRLGAKEAEAAQTVELTMQDNWVIVPIDVTESFRAGGSYQIGTPVMVGGRPHRVIGIFSY